MFIVLSGKVNVNYFICVPSGSNGSIIGLIKFTITIRHFGQRLFLWYLRSRSLTVISRGKSTKTTVQTTTLQKNSITSNTALVGTTNNFACQGMSPYIRARLTFIMAMYRIHNAHNDNKKISTVEMLIHESISNVR